MRSGGGALTGRGVGRRRRTDADGFLVRQWEGREWKGGRGEGATSVHFSISLSPFGFDRSVSLPSPSVRKRVRPSCARIRHAVMSGAEWGGRARRPLRSLHISNGRRDGSDRFFSSFSPRKSLGCLLWSPSPSVLFFFNCSTRRDGGTDGPTLLSLF